MPTTQLARSRPSRWHNERHTLDRRANAALTAMAPLPRTHPVRRRNRRDLVEMYMPMARRLARRYYAGGEPIEDLEQVAVVGLLQAVDRFDTGKGQVFAAFAIPTITGELRRHFRDHVNEVRVPRRVQDVHHRIQAVREELTQRLRRVPTVPDLASHLDVTADEVVEAIALGGARRCASLDVLNGPDRSPGGDRYGEEDPDLLGADVRVTAQQLLATLPERQRRIVWLRFWRERSQSEIAAEVGISQMHVSRLLSNALGTMREVAERADSAEPEERA